MSRYLDVLDECGVPAQARVLSALGPKMLEMAASRSAGTHPYLTVPAQTAEARSALGPDESVSTVDLTVDYLEPAGAEGTLRARAELVRKGNRVCHVRIAVTQDGRLVAEGRGVYNIHVHKRPG